MLRVLRVLRVRRWMGKSRGRAGEQRWNCQILPSGHNLKGEKEEKPGNCRGTAEEGRWRVGEEQGKSRGPNLGVQ